MNVTICVIIGQVIGPVLGQEDKPPASLTDPFIYMMIEGFHHVPIIIVCEKRWLNIRAAQMCDKSSLHLPN